MSQLLGDFLKNYTKPNICWRYEISPIVLGDVQLGHLPTPDSWMLEIIFHHEHQGVLMSCLKNEQGFYTCVFFP